jgi:hypothetical protein
VLATPWFLATRCACGFEALADEQVIDHVLAVFESADAVGADGKPHEEMKERACSCGFSAISSGEMDAHFLAAFTPVGQAGRDGRTHEPLSSPRTSSDPQPQAGTGLPDVR